MIDLKENVSHFVNSITMSKTVSTTTSRSRSIVFCVYTVGFIISGLLPRTDLCQNTRAYLCDVNLDSHCHLASFKLLWVATNGGSFFFWSFLFWVVSQQKLNSILIYHYIRVGYQSSDAVSYRHWLSFVAKGSHIGSS